MVQIKGTQPYSCNQQSSYICQSLKINDYQYCWYIISYIWISCLASKMSDKGKKVDQCFLKSKPKPALHVYLCSQAKYIWFIIKQK